MVLLSPRYSTKILKFEYRSIAKQLALTDLCDLRRDQTPASALAKFVGDTNLDLPAPYGIAGLLDGSFGAAASQPADPT